MNAAFKLSESITVARSTDFSSDLKKILTNLRFLKNLKKFDGNLKMFFNVSVSKIFLTKISRGKQ